MCSQMDDPTQYDAPEPTRPRAYVLSGSSRNSIGEPRPSIALAVLGDLLTEAEQLAIALPDSIVVRAEVDTLRNARNRVADAEARG